MLYFEGGKLEFIKEYVEKIIHDKTNMYHTKAEIARALEIKPQYLNSILTGNRAVSDKFFHNFINVFNISQDTLNNKLSDLSHKPNDVVEEFDERKASIHLDVYKYIINEKDNKIIELSVELAMAKAEIEKLRKQIPE